MFRKTLLAVIASLLLLIGPTVAAAETPTTTTTTATSNKVDGPSQAMIRAWAAAYQKHLVEMWVRAYNWNKWMAAAVKYEAAKKAAAASYPSGQCGGSLPPCYVMMRESRGNIHAQNPRSTASGKWQFLDSTWAGYGGYAKARYAPEKVQDAKARQLWAGGRGCSHWAAC